MFDFLYDLDETAVGVTALIGVVWGWFLFTDPLNNMQNMPVVLRAIGFIIGIPVSYYIAERMLEN